MFPFHLGPLCMLLSPPARLPLLCCGFARIRAAQRAVHAMSVAHHTSVAQRKGLERKLVALGLDVLPDFDTQSYQEMLSALLSEEMKKSQDAAIAVWRKKVRTWNVTDSQLFAYLKNVSPCKHILP